MLLPIIPTCYDPATDWSPFQGSASPNTPYSVDSASLTKASVQVLLKPGSIIFVIHTITKSGQNAAATTFEEANLCSDVETTPSFYNCRLAFPNDLKHRTEQHNRCPICCEDFENGESLSCGWQWKLVKLTYGGTIDSMELGDRL